jgi:hypothetical protein
MKPTPTISSLEKEFDKKFVSFEDTPGGAHLRGFSWRVNADEVKSFYRTQILSILEGLKGRRRIMINNVPESDEIYGYNQAISEFNKRIERAKK